MGSSLQSRLETRSSGSGAPRRRPRGPLLLVLLASALVLSGGSPCFIPGELESGRYAMTIRGAEATPGLATCPEGIDDLTDGSVHTLELRNLGSRRYEARLEYRVGGEPVVVLMNGSRDRNANSIFLRGRTDVGFLECRGFVDMALSTFAQDEPIRSTLGLTYFDQTCRELEQGQCTSRLNARLRRVGPLEDEDAW